MHKQKIEWLINRRKSEFQLVQRATIILLAHDEIKDIKIAKRLNISRQTVSKWKKRWSKFNNDKVSVHDILSDDPRTGAPPKFTPEQGCHLMAMACDHPQDYNRPISHWSPRELADELENKKIVKSISPRQVARFLNEADLKPHRMRYYLHTEKDEEFDRKTKDICDLYHSAEEINKNNGKVISCDEMCGVQALERTAPDKPMIPGKVARREFNYKRHGTLCLIANIDVATGKIINPTVGPTRTEKDFEKHIKKMISNNPCVIRWHIVVDNLNTHQSESLVKLVAEIENIDKERLGIKGKSGILKSKKTREEFLTNSEHKITFHYTPKHASWLNQIEIWFSILVRKLLKRESFDSIEDLKERILSFIDYFNETMAKPFKWTYGGKILTAN